MGDRIETSYRLSKNIYDDVLTQGRWWSRLYIRLFWGGVDDGEIARRLLERVPEDFSGRLLDVPAGTAVFTAGKYARLAKAEITCLDFSEDMLSQARARFGQMGLSHIRAVRGDVGRLPFADETFDIVLCMNGVHAFPDKERAYREMRRVLKRGGEWLACFYIEGESRITDFLVKRVLAKKGWFTPPFETRESLKRRLSDGWDAEMRVEGSMVWFRAKKRG